MYIEQNSKERRANSFIISGLPAASDKSDSELALRLCNDEFGLTVDMQSTKRLGREATDRPRPLVVFIRSREQAQAIIQTAKRLRQSSDATVRSQVYINPNLTKAEAKAMYEIRQRRRLGKNNQQTNEQPASSNSSQGGRPVNH